MLLLNIIIFTPLYLSIGFITFVGLYKISERKSQTFDVLWHLMLLWPILIPVIFLIFLVNTVMPWFTGIVKEWLESNENA